MNQPSNIANRLNSKDFYELADISNNVLFWETDENLVITYINACLFELTRLEPEQVIGKKLNEVLIADEVDVWQKITQSTSTYEDLRFKIKSQHGQFSHLIACGKAVVKDNKIVGYYGVCTVETENIITKQVIKRLQNTNRTILSSLNEALIIVDMNNRLVVVSPGFIKLWGLKKGEIFLNPIEKTLEYMQKLLNNNPLKPCLEFNQHLDHFKKTKDILKFKDGRTIERKSSPHVNDGEIIGRCWYFIDITQQLVLVEKLGKLAFRDSLTKLYNRRWCEKKLKQLLRSSQTNSLAFLYMDLDYFKVINDSCGHIHGDDVLEEVSQLLLDTVGAKAYLSRLGGDEFGLMLIKQTQSEIMEVAKNIKTAISNYTYQWKKKIFKLGISIGVVFVEDEDDFRSVFVHADEACYLSKETGRNKCTVYNAEKEEFQKTKTELKWYDAIQKALLKGKFELWCQPINEIKVTNPHYEILLRMRTENNDLISPGLFMGSADRFGMIFSIDKLVIDSFCQFYQENNHKVSGTLFSINISGHSLSRDGFLPFVLNCLDKYSIDCTNICFEITESEIIKNIDKALVFIKRVRDLGCKISLDDFGKGLTSFSYLKNIPYDFIKIDGQFIKELNDDKINAAIIKSIVYIAEVMNKKTIAEHIESEHLLNQVSALGVNYFQGNYFSKPHQITKLLE